jgi:argonaute-like protein implicated in RNA metabolism and viral defense
MDIKELVDEKSRLEREIARLLKQFEDEWGIEVAGASITSGQNREKFSDDNSVVVKGERYFRVKITVEV